ncbi:3-methyl-2-oxobutanoate hydroxymethyltransferase [Phytoactinopolyspora alkaliphila]|uniref:3-methyl-2-oxobutanoate hydroxymethyltransferase n=1 Tax=Phytoactinopolyspora alkaliphila TaxID=1783498 RepID=A0A6N9YNV3_9ACTN|nr:3-methyl-2-oxobutanoate hydroxymethyltransferase [Phytoactinopolyspora alkaliphila]NED96625.1 3-methyl-2-oxobutanoate hydroxymethyltransferase [Phytoactinopolyspora alkaliphila]
MTVEKSPLYGGEANRRITIRDLRTAKERGERWPMLTAYDMYTAEIFDQAGIPVLLVGDSAGNNVYAHTDTIPVTIEEMMPLARAVVRSAKRALVVCDLPFGSYQIGSEQALATSIQVMKETGVQAVKLEGGLPAVDSVHRIVEAGIPVMAHVGFTPQSVNAIGGYRVQGRGAQGEDLLTAALALEKAGAFSIVLEMVAADVAAEITKRLSIPVIGIGAGPDCDAQVLVWQDMAGMRSGAMPRFVKAYGDLRAGLTSAAKAFAEDVTTGQFPGEEHTYR